MSECVYERIGDGTKKEHKYRCGLCDHERESNYLPNMLHRHCGIQVPRQLKPGNILHELLRERIGIGTTAKCRRCDEKQTLMNMQGPAWCRENLDWIVDGLLDEARKRDWKIEGKPLLSLAAKYGTTLPWGMSYARAWARSLVLEAIESCENQ